MCCLYEESDMITFVAGMMFGGVVGVFTMALFIGAKDSQN